VPSVNRDSRLLAGLSRWWVVWTVAVFLGSAVVLRRLSRHQAPPARRIRSREERALGWSAVFIGLLIVFARPNIHGPQWLLLWICCAVVVGALGGSGLWRARRHERQHIAVALYGAIAALSFIFPTESVPRQFRLLVSIVMLAIGVAMAVLLLLSSVGLGDAAAAKEPTA
jgi:hypothetical protein